MLRIVELCLGCQCQKADSGNRMIMMMMMMMMMLMTITMMVLRMVMIVMKMVMMIISVDDDDVRMSGTGCPHPADIGRPRPPRSILYRGRQFAFKLSHPLLPPYYASLQSISLFIDFIFLCSRFYNSKSHNFIYLIYMSFIILYILYPC